MDIDELLKNGRAEIGTAINETSLDQLRQKYLGKKGVVAQLTSELSRLPPTERKSLGQKINRLKTQLTELFLTRENSLKTHPNTIAKVSQVDSTLPAEKIETGNLHFVSQAIFEIEKIFSHLGFIRRRYPEVELDYYAFEALNISKNHPARDETESFYLNDSIVLTPHTSNGQVRELEKGKLPVRMINIAKCYRRESDIGHSPMFHQFEGLLVDENISITDLKGVFDYFVKNFFGSSRKIRLRPYHFNFTEPSFEVDIDCHLCGGAGCRFCKGGWTELGGAGMVHPQVIRNGGMDPMKVNGFAFGWGVERTFLMRSGINLGDVRLSYSTDLRILKQF